MDKSKEVSGAILLAEAKVHSEENFKPERLDLELERNGERNGNVKSNFHQIEKRPIRLNENKLHMVFCFKCDKNLIHCQLLHAS